MNPADTDQRARLRPRVVVMGVSGAGKSTVGAQLARRLGVPFADADEFHSTENIAKMAAGKPLSDEDRWSWLDRIGRWLEERSATGAVATCSALRRQYRDALRAHVADAWFLYLDGNIAVIKTRVAHRPHHFMPAALLDSQFDTLEPPQPDEQAVELDTSCRPDEIVDEFLDHIRIGPTGKSWPITEIVLSVSGLVFVLILGLSI
jgi:gluconokinase